MIRRAVMLAACLASLPAQADPANRPGLTYKRLYVRGGLVHVAPLSSSRELQLSDVHGPASLAVMDGPIAGSGVGLDPVTVPAAIIGYTLPWLDDRLSIETILGAPLHVKFRATGSLADMSIAPVVLGIPTGVPALGSELGEATALPPIVTLVYRLAEIGRLRPYAGTGIGALITYDARATNPVLSEVGQPRMHIDPAFGWALQAGLDVRLWRGVVARADIKYIAFMHARARVDDIEVRTPGLPLFDTAAVGSATMDMSVNPLIVLIGVGVDL